MFINQALAVPVLKKYAKTFLAEDALHVDVAVQPFRLGCLRGFERCLREHLKGTCLNEKLFDKMKSPPTTVNALLTPILKLSNAEASKEDIKNKMAIRGQLDVTELLFTPDTIQQ